MSIFAPKPAVGPSPDYAFPTAADWRLPNGVRVVHLPTASRLLSLTLATPTGHAAPGLAALATRVRVEGAGDLTGREFAAAISRIGASLDTEVTRVGALLRIAVPARQLAAALRLLADTAVRPTLSDEDVHQQRALLVEEIHQSLAYADEAADIVLDRTIFEASDPRHIPVAGTPESVATLTADDVRAHIRSHVTPSSTTLIVVGQCERADLDGALAALAGWEGAATPTDSLPAAQPAGPGVAVDAREGAVQTQIRLGAATFGRDDARWAPLAVAAHVLGGSLNSRLSTVLREEKGYTYGVFADLAPSGTAGRFAISLGVDASVLDDALGDLRALLADALVGITDEECAAGVTELLGRDPMRYQTPNRLASVLEDAVTHGLPLNWINEHRAALARVRAADVKAALGDVVQLASPRVALVGPGEVARAAAARVFPEVSIKEG